MFIRCSDGKLYRDPTWNVAESHILTCTELCYKLRRVNTPSWSSVRRGLKDYPIRPINEAHRHEDKIFGQLMKPALIFGIKFIGRPPVPSEHAGWLVDASGITDDEVLDFP